MSAALTHKFTFRLSAEENEILDSLAFHLQRSRADALRYLLREQSKFPHEAAGMQQIPVGKFAANGRTFWLKLRPAEGHK